ncbi:MAG: glycoside hydrolase family 3 protein [Nitrospirae bacterium]|nr:glycoside hydrolase family 3 protein [Nitrospirota bacterium]
MISKKLSLMPLEEKIGQLMLIGFQGRHLSNKDIAHIKKIRPGGIVFYSRNFRDATDIPPLIAKITSVAPQKSLPMFFAIDQEGGIVHRIQGEFYKPPSEPAIGATDSEKIARDIGLAVGRSLRNIGINVNLAPVLDIPSDLVHSPLIMRSYGTDPDKVERLGISYIKGLREAGLLSTAKHFPGIGKALEDAHYSLPHLKWDTEAEKARALRPFAGAVEAGTDMLMVSHVIAGPESSLPVSLSAYWMQVVLRRELNFKGLIVVDNIEMKAIESQLPVASAAVESVKAGADIIMVSHERTNQEKVFFSLLDAARRGEISRSRLDESVGRIIEAKGRVKPVNAKRGSYVNDLRDISRSVAEHSVTALGLNDLTPVIIDKDSKVLYTGYNLTLFKGLQDVFRQNEILNTPLAMYKKMFQGFSLRDFLRRFDGIIIDADYPDAFDIIALCKETGQRYVVMLNHPSLTFETLGRLKPDLLIVTFENTRLHYGAALQVIQGTLKAKGRLPYRQELPAHYGYL